MDERKQQFMYAEPNGEDRWAPVFAVAAEPHVMIMFRRVFGDAAKQSAKGYMTVCATPANASMLRWFMQKFPLEPFNGESLAHLEKLANEHDAKQQSLQRILAGATPDYGAAREPAIEPREYQRQVPALLYRTGGFILADDLGLGKTFSSSLILCNPEALPALVVGPKHLVRQWVNEELPKTHPWLRCHIARTSTPYDLTRYRGRDVEMPHVVAMNYHKLKGWAEALVSGQALGRAPRTVIFDEAHELRTGPKTSTGGSAIYEAAVYVAGAARYRIGCTATPIYNYGDESFHVIDALNPGALGTKDEFNREWGGKHIKDPRGYGSYLRAEGLMLRRTRDDVGRQLGADPMLIEQPVETDHAKLKALMEQGIVAMAQKVMSGSREERFTASGQLDMRMRHATGVAKAPFVAEFVRMVLASTDKVVLTGHHHDVFDIWRDALAEFNPVLYTGQQSPAAKDAAKDAFINGDSRVMIMALRSGAGLNGLQTVCNTVVFGELDWSPAQHDQIIGRFHRDGQPKVPVMAFFLVSDDGADPPMADILQLKKSISRPIRDPDAQIVQPSAADAQARVQALAKAVLDKHGVAGAPLPEPQPGGALITRDTLRDRMGGSRP